MKWKGFLIYFMLYYFKMLTIMAKYFSQSCNSYKYTSKLMLRKFSYRQFGPKNYGRVVFFFHAIFLDDVGNHGLSTDSFMIYELLCLLGKHRVMVSCHSFIFNVVLLDWSPPNAGKKIGGFLPFPKPLVWKGTKQTWREFELVSLNLFSVLITAMLSSLKRPL